MPRLPAIFLWMKDTLLFTKKLVWFKSFNITGSSPGQENRESSPGQENRESSPGQENRESSPGQENRESSPGQENRESSPGQENRESRTTEECLKITQEESTEKKDRTRTLPNFISLLPLTPDTSCFHHTFFQHLFGYFNREAFQGPLLSNIL